MFPTQIAVILSTYNGEKYLEEQVESILAQEDADVRLLIRDDGSRDSTTQYLHALESRHVNVRCIVGSNKGVTESFMTALREADADCEFFAFADQDDVWSPRKLANAVETLRGASDPDQPLLYCSKLELVDERLRHLAYTRAWRNISFENALFQNVVCGCTVVMNGAARRLVLRGGSSRNILLHDWWCYLAVSAFGQVLYDDRSGIKYRQHGNNYVGAQSSLAGRIRRRFKRTLNGVYGRFPSEQNEYFLKIYGNDLTADKRRAVEMALVAKRSLVKRLALAGSREIRMQTPIEEFFTRLGVILNKF